MSADSHHENAEMDPVVHAPEGSVFAWPEYELDSTFEPLEDEEHAAVYYFYPRAASDRVIEREWIMAPSSLVLDVVDVR
jgi:hypothetical protein